MSINFNSFSTSFLTQAYQNFSQYSAGGGVSLSSLGISQVSDSFGFQGGAFNFASLLSSLGEARMPRPPMYGASLAQAAMSLGNFAGSISPFAKAGGFGYSQALGISSLNALVSDYQRTQLMYGKGSISSLHVGVEVTNSGPAALDRTLKDEFAASNSAGKGHESNLSNSPEVVLALNNILKGHADNMPMAELQKKLKEEYGINATLIDKDNNPELFKEIGRKALKFDNGDMMVDASGNGSMGTQDYKFDKAVKSITEKYGLTENDIKDFGTEEGKKQLGALSNWHMNMQLPQQQTSRYDFNMTSMSGMSGMSGMNKNWMGMPNSFIDMNMFQQLFSKAFSYGF